MSTRRFSERLGLVQPRSTFQKEYIDDRLWSRLWSTMGRAFWNHFTAYCDKDGDDFTRFVVCEIQDDFFGRPIDEIGWETNRFINNLKVNFPRQNWAAFYDLVQFLADFSKSTEPGEPYSQVRMHAEYFIAEANKILEVEKSAYRFIGGELVEITSEVEIHEIETAVASQMPFDASKEHLTAALQLFGKRDNPDFRNSIKEAISAVESALSHINGEKSKSLVDAIAKAEKNGIIFPPALKEGIKKIYGWTSDENGVRHALFDVDTQVGDAEARFMIVMCSSLVNFLVVLSQRTGAK